MRDQACRLVNDISLSIFAHLNWRYDVPNEREIHLRNDNAEFRSNAGHGYRHIRLRLVDEIDRPIIDFVGHRLTKCRFLRMIDVTLDDIRRFPRHAILLSSRRIELHDLGQRRHLAHHANRIELPFIQRAIAQGHMGFPHQSRRDLVKKLADFVCR